MVRKRLSLLSVVTLLCLFEVGTINSSDEGAQPKTYTTLERLKKAEGKRPKKGAQPKTYTITLKQLKEAFTPDICGSYYEVEFRTLLFELEENLGMSNDDFETHMLARQKLFKQINSNLKPEFRGKGEVLLENHMLIKEDNKITFHNPIGLSKD